MPFLVALIAALVKIAVVLGYILAIVPMIVWLERKLIADCQARIGPNRVGPFGLLQSFADGIKLVMKEAIMPTEVDRLLYLAGPVVTMIPALAVVAVVPFGGDIRIGEYTHQLVIADLPVGILFILAFTSLSVYGIVLSGWSSANKYSLLGGLRSSAQMVSYELPMGLSVIAGLMIASHASSDGLFNLSLSRVVEAQAGGFWNWTALNPKFFFLGLTAMLMFYICGLAETNRAPFDLPEAETELIGGYHTEYGGLRWAMFFMGEYAAMLNVSAITTSVFLGGWHAPYPDTLLFAVGSPGYMLQGLFWFGLKVAAIIVIYIWIRATVPRLRYDRLMSFGWKILLPVSLVNILIIATLLTLFFSEPPPAALAQPGAAGRAAPAAGPGPGAPGSPALPAGPAPEATVPGGPAPEATVPGGSGPEATVPGGSGPETHSSPGGAPAAPAAPPAPGGEGH